MDYRFGHLFNEITDFQGHLNSYLFSASFKKPKKKKSDTKKKKKKKNTKKKKKNTKKKINIISW